MPWHATKKASKLPSLDKSKILVFDTETTGLEPALDEILQITILNGHGSVLFNSYIKPTRHKIWPIAEKINHISPEMVADMPTFSEVRAEIQELFNQATLVVGYNVNFDINFVKAAGIIVSGTVFDVMTAFASYRAAVDKTAYRRCKLTECAEYFGHYYSPHDSSEDARATLQCFESLIGDPRFTTYKKEEKQQLKEETPVSKTKPKTKFTIQLPARRRKGFLFWGILIAAAAEAVLYFTRHALIYDVTDYINQIMGIAANWSTDRLKSVLYIAFGIGVLFVTIGLILFIIRLPRLIIAKIKHLINRFN